MKKTRISTPQGLVGTTKGQITKPLEEQALQRSQTSGRLEPGLHGESEVTPGLRHRSSHIVTSVIDYLGPQFYSLAAPGSGSQLLCFAPTHFLNPSCGICKLPALDLWQPADSFRLASVEASRLEFKGPRVGRELGSHPNLCQALLPSPRPLPSFA